MKYVILALLLAFALAESHPVNHEMIASIKESATTWTPMKLEDNPFSFMSIEQIKSMMGTKLEVVEETLVDSGADVPDNFDAREEWGEFIHPIRDQGQCGSCWAFGATEALSDRFAISGGLDVVLSAQQLVSCDTDNMGCNGGYLERAWTFMATTGVVSDTCYPYTSGVTKKNGECKSTCENGAEWTLHHADGSFSSRTPKSTEQEIQKNGPVEAGFTVYEDFMNYKSGIYQHTTGSQLGGHAIKCVGWGVESGTKYWIMANSWGTGWGEAGFFKIKQGDCGIDSQMTFGTAASITTLTE
jgi:cathepsin B